MDTSLNCWRKMLGNHYQSGFREGRGVGFIEPFMNLSQKIFSRQNIYYFPRQMFFLLTDCRTMKGGNGSQSDDGEQTATKLFTRRMITQLGLNPLVEKTVKIVVLFYQLLFGVVFSIQILQKVFLLAAESEAIILAPNFSCFARKKFPCDLF